MMHMDYDFSEFDDNIIDFKELLFNPKNHVNYSGLGMYIFNGTVSPKNMFKLKPSCSTSERFNADGDNVELSL